MLKKVLLTALAALAIILLVVFVVCDTDEPGSEYAPERDDLIMINLSVKNFNYGSTGVYVFFFEDYPTRLAFLRDVQIIFDSSIDRPIVRAKSFTRWRGSGDITMNGVEVIFKNEEQMKEYWIVG